MICFRQAAIVLGLEGNLYFKDFTNNFSFVFVVDEKNLCWSFFNF